MYHLLLILSLWINSDPDIEIKIASGGSEKISENWTQLKDIDEVSLGTSYWVCVEIGPLDQAYTLQAGNWYMQNVHFYDEQQSLIHVGNAVEIHPSSVDQKLFLYYSFHDEKDPDFFSITLLRTNDFLTKKYSKNLFQSVFNAILLFVLLVCCFFIFSSAQNIYINYILYISSILTFFSYQYGLLGSLLPFVKNIPPTWMWILSASISFTYVLFSRSFLDMKRTDPFNYKVSTFGLFFIGMIVLTESVSRFFAYDILHQIWYKAIILTIEFGLMIVFVYRIATMKTIISNIFLIGAFILVLSSLTGQIASTFKVAYETNLFVQIGLLIDVFILSIGIAVRVALIQKEKQKAQLELIEQLKVNEKLQRDYLKKLEDEVMQRTADLNHRNKENETLLKEVHHRVKNNLQMITSLLNMQQRRLKEESAKKALKLTKNRVKSISLIHEHLYKHDDFSKIDLEEYVEELAFILIDSLYRGSKKIATSLQIQSLKVDIDIAIPIGIILNELVTNSIKYAFQSNPDPTLEIKLNAVDDELVLDVIDNGEGIKSSSNGQGFGNTIIKALLENHEGTLKYPEVKTGFCARVKLKNSKMDG
ncbi:histidine kinase dimerization/phosphoacceptor domain -containing protein [Ekhidna sp. MALMAid0563]|uniref:sensor histidine kinase n=1 Tax=Ekhidna sp. MALMAid0563 TaxID=3143937 RepID=UPI0032E02495